jgi:arabinose-5-phosphate isomerase
MSHLNCAREVFEIEIAALRAVKKGLDSSFDAAVDLVLQSLQKRGKVVVVGIGKSGNVGQKISSTLTSIGATSVLLNSVDALHGDLGVLNDGDVVLALSYSGESEELLNLLPAMKRFLVRIIALTGAPKSSLGKLSDVVLNVKVPKEACPFNLAPTSSTTAMLVMGDALAMALLSARNFRKQDYAKHHPAGAIGRALLLKISDIMRTGERNPLVDQKTSVKDALLVGVFTDGDLRRHMSKDENILSRSLSEVMTPNPISIQEDSPAMEALKIFNERNIDDLIVVNHRREPVGMVDLQDLPKLKMI